MDLKKLRSFVMVADTGTVSAAAQALRITQPALSRQLQDLQADFGMALFAPVGRRLGLTAEGAALLPECRALLAQAEALAESGRVLTRGDRGVLRVGATPHLIANFFPGLIHKFGAAFPNVRVQTVEGGGLDHLEALRRGDLHAAITSLDRNETEFAAYALPPSRLLVAWRPDGAIKLGEAVEVQELADLPLLVLTTSFATRKNFDAACRLERLVPRIFLESTAPETLLALAREGHGLAIVPTTAPITRGNLRLAPLMFRGQPVTVRSGVLWNGQPRYAEAFNATLFEHMQAVMSAFEAVLLGSGYGG